MGVTNDRVTHLSLSLEELEAVSNLLHGRAHIRFNPDEKWTAIKLMDLRTRVDSELALLKAEHPTLAIKRCPHGVLSKYPCLECDTLFRNP